MQIIDTIRSSFRIKLLLGFLAAAVIPYIITMIVLFVNTQEKFKHGIIKDLSFQASIIANELETTLNDIYKDFSFLSTLQIMDDIQTNDLDKRISTLLEAKKKDLLLEGEYICANTNGQILASSNQHLIGKTIPKEYIVGNNTGLHYSSLIGTNCITFTKIINASYDSTTPIGILILEYGVKNFDHFLYNEPSRSTFLYNPLTSQTIAVEGRELPNKKPSGIGNFETATTITSYQSLKSPLLKNWHLALSEDKTTAMHIIGDFHLLMAISLFVGLLLIISASYVIAEKVTMPIKKLSDTALSITKNRDFTQRVSITSKDEIKQLADSFNGMVRETGQFLEHLERENEDRLRMFIKLIEMFNSISLADSSEKSVQIAIDEMRNFLDCHELAFESTRPNDERHIFEITVHNYKTDSDEPYGYICVSESCCEEEHDRRFFGAIVKMVGLQIEKINLLKNTQAASEAKSSFISNMSHELRTPLNGIIGFAQFLGTLDNFPQNYRSIPKKIEVAGNHLLLLINDILDMAKIEAGKITPFPLQTDIIPLLENVHSMVSYQLQDKGLEFIFEHPESIIISTDPKLLSQIVLNLVSNAIKFTENGFIKLVCTKENKTVTVQVIDSGIGFDKTDGEKLFGEFEQLENPLQKKYKGSGLGLALSRKLSILLGGTLTLVSEGQTKGALATLTFCEL